MFCRKLTTFELFNEIQEKIIFAKRFPHDLKLNCMSTRKVRFNTIGILHTSLRLVQQPIDQSESISKTFQKFFELEIKRRTFRFNKRSIKHSLTVDIDTKPIHGRMTQQNNMKTERITTMPRVVVVHCLHCGNFPSASRENFISSELLRDFCEVEKTRLDQGITVAFSRLCKLEI